MSSVFGGYNVARAETQCRLCNARIKLQKNKRVLTTKKLRKDIAEMLRDGKQEYARIRVEGVIRENLLMQAYEILELYLELIAVRAQLIAKTKEIPRDMVEAVSSIIYAAQRVSDVPELNELRKMFAAKYGKEYASEASSDVTCTKWQVNANLMRCLLVEPPQPEEKLAMLSEIAQEAGVEWDASAAYRELLPHGTAPPPPPPPRSSGGGGGGAGGGGGVALQATAAAAGQQHFNGPPAIPAALGPFTDPQQAAAAAAAAAAHAKAMADYAAQLAVHQSVNSGHAAPPAPPGPPPQGWMLGGPGASGSGGGAAAGSSTAAAQQPRYNGAGGSGGGVAAGRTAEDIQRAYDAAVGPPEKGALHPPASGTTTSSAPPSLALPTPPRGGGAGAGALPTTPVDLPRPPGTVLPGTLDLPRPPTGTVPAEPEEEYDELARRLEMLKRG